MIPPLLPLSPPISQEDSSLPNLKQALSPLERSQLHQALNGDIALMTKLIAEWEIDTQLMEHQSGKLMNHLSSKSFLKSQMIGRQLIAKQGETKGCLPGFLPQTYVAASFMLALSPEQIVALPKGLREHPHLFSPQLMERIPLDIDRYHFEQLYMSQPQGAFVSHYSHPSTIDALRNQGIPIYLMEARNTASVICQEIIHMGKIMNCSEKAELLVTFIEAALYAIENRLAYLQMQSKKDAPLRLLLLYYHTQYSMPTKKTLTGHLLERLQMQRLVSLLSPSDSEQEEWTIPISQEQIVHLNPDCLIIASEAPDLLPSHLLKDPALMQLSATHHHSVFYIDEVVQQFPSQLIVLAYYDIFYALAKAYVTP